MALEEKAKEGFREMISSHFFQMTNLVSLLDNPEYKFEAGLYSEIATAAKSMQEHLDNNDARQVNDLWFDRNIVSCIVHCSNAAHSIERAIDFAKTNGNIMSLQDYVEEYSEMVSIFRGWVRILNRELVQDYKAILGIESVLEGNPAEYLEKEDSRIMPEKDRQQITLTWKQQNELSSAFTEMFMDILNAYSKAYANTTNEKQEQSKKDVNDTLKSHFDKEHISPLLSRMEKLRSFYNSRIRNTTLEAENPNYKKVMMYFENGIKCLEAAESLLEMKYEYLESPREDTREESLGRKITDMIAEEEVEEIARNLAFNNAHNLIKSAFKYHVFGDMQTADINQVVMMLELTDRLPEDIGQVYHRLTLESEWKPMLLADAKTYQMIDECSALDNGTPRPERYYDKIAIVMPNAKPSSQPKSGIRIVKSLSEL